MDFDDVNFDGFSFKDNGIVLNNINHMTIASRDNQVEKRANRDGAVLVQSQLGTKPIYIEGYYTGDGPTAKQDAELMYDTLAAALNRQERPLLIPHAGGTRRFIATPENIIITQPSGLNRIVFSLEFVIPEGNAEEEIPTRLFSQTITTPTATVPFTVLGSVKARPIINLTLTSVAGGTAGTISIRNARDFIGLTIFGNFVSGDTLIIDSDNFQIFHNGILLEPVGRIPTWETGSGSLYYSDTFSSRTVLAVGDYNIKNL